MRTVSASMQTPPNELRVLLSLKLHFKSSANITTAPPIPAPDFATVDKKLIDTPLEL